MDTSHLPIILYRSVSKSDHFSIARDLTSIKGKHFTMERFVHWSIGTVVDTPNRNNPIYTLRNDNYGEEYGFENLNQISMKDINAINTGLIWMRNNPKEFVWKSVR